MASVVTLSYLFLVHDPTCAGSDLSLPGSLSAPEQRFQDKSERKGSGRSSSLESLAHSMSVREPCCPLCTVSGGQPSFRRKMQRCFSGTMLPGIIIVTRSTRQFLLWPLRISSLWRADCSWRSSSWGESSSWMERYISAAKSSHLPLKLQTAKPKQSPFINAFKEDKTHSVGDQHLMSRACTPSLQPFTHVRVSAGRFCVWMEPRMDPLTHEQPKWWERLLFHMHWWRLIAGCWLVWSKEGNAGLGRWWMWRDNDQSWSINPFTSISACHIIHSAYYCATIGGNPSASFKMLFFLSLCKRLSWHRYRCC